MPFKPITIYGDTTKGCIFFENSTVSPKFLGTVQASAHPDLSDRIIIVRTDRFKAGTTDFRPLFRKLNMDRILNESGQELVGDLGFTRSQVINYINTECQATGSSVAGQAPVITSSSTLALTTGDTLNYELTADFGVGYEWSGLPSGVATVDGNVRKLIGGSSLAAGTYNFTAKAINYFGEDTENISLTVSNPAFQDSKSVNFAFQDFMGANAALAPALERSTGNSGTPWTLSFWFKPANNSSAQTLFYFGNNDITNQGHIELRQQSTTKLRLRYGSSNNNIQIQTATNTLTPGQWHHIMITYAGGQTGASSGSLSGYYSQFKIFVDGVEPSRSNSHSNYGYSGSIVGQNLRLGKYLSGSSIRGGSLDEVSIHDSDLSSSISTLYNGGSPSNLASLSPDNWWRMGDGDSYPLIQDVGSQGSHMIMYNMTAASIVSDTP